MGIPLTPSPVFCPPSEEASVSLQLSASLWACSVGEKWGGWRLGQESSGRLLTGGAMGPN